MTKAVVVIPFRDKGDTARKANLARVLTHLDSITDAGVIVVTDGFPDGPFNRSAAYNRGMALAPADTDVFVFHEADMLIGHAALYDAIAEAQHQPGMVVPFSEYRYLSLEDTIKVRDGEDPRNCTAEHVMADCRSNGAVNVLSRTSLQMVGCWDETFSGWGFDDRAMARAFEVATGSPTRYITANAYHLWHTPGWSVESRFKGGANIPPHEHAATIANESRYRRYKKARSPAQIRALTAGG